MEKSWRSIPNLLAARGLLEVADVAGHVAESELQSGRSDQKASKAIVTPCAACSPSIRPREPGARRG